MLHFDNFWRSTERVWKYCKVVDYETDRIKFLVNLNIYYGFNRGTPMSSLIAKRVPFLIRHI